MNYINLSTLEFPLHEGDIRIDHPEIGDVFVCPSTHAMVQVNSEPQFDRECQKLQFGVPYSKNNEWFVDLVVVNLSEEEKLLKNKKLSEIEENPHIKKIREQIEKEIL